MISFKQFLSEQERASRTKQVDALHATNWMDSNCSGYLNGGKYLLRGFSGEDNILMGTSITSTDRVSANISNYYTLWLDNHPSFKDWPKRSKSFICSTYASTADSYGDVYIVVPADKNKVGLVQETDMWYVDLGENSPARNMQELVYFTENLLEQVGLDPVDTTYAELQETFKKIDIEFLADWIDQADDEDEAENLIILTKKLKKSNCNNYFELWEKVVTPNLFKQVLASKIGPAKGEVWVEGECVFIPANQTTVGLTDQADLLEWSEEYPAFKHFLMQHWDDSVDDSEKIDAADVSDEDTLTSTQKKQK